MINFTGPYKPRQTWAAHEAAPASGTKVRRAFKYRETPRVATPVLPTPVVSRERTPEEVHACVVADYETWHRDLTPEQSERARVIRAVSGGYSIPGDETVYAEGWQAVAAVLA